MQMASILTHAFCLMVPDHVDLQLSNLMLMAKKSKSKLGEIVRDNQKA